MPDQELMRRCERAEAMGFYSIMLHVSDGAKRDLGIQSTVIAGAPAWRTREIPAWTLFNRVVGLGLFGDVVPADLDQLPGFFEDSFHMVEASPLADTLKPEDLIARGYRAHSSRPKFVRSSEPRALPEGVKVRRATDDDADTFAELVAESFHLPAVAKGWLTSIARTPHEGRFLVFAEVDGTLAGVGAVTCTEGVGWLSGGCCSPKFRGRGVQRAVIEGRSAVAREFGAEWITAETDPDDPDAPGYSFRNVIRCGFELAYERPQFVKGIQPE